MNFGRSVDRPSLPQWRHGSLSEIAAACALNATISTTTQRRPFVFAGGGQNAIGRHGTVTDDWPEDVPVAEAEIDVFEAWFGDLLDELFG
jgi:hypothetical protein